MGLCSVLVCCISSECRLDVLLCSNTKITFAKHIRFLLVVSKLPKTEHKPIYFHSKPSTKMEDNKAINAIKAHASCDRERALA